MLQDLKNIEKLFVKKYNERAQANKAKAATTPKMAERVPKKHAHGGGSNRGAPKMGHSTKYCKWCKTANGPYTTHDTIKCCRFEKDGMPKDKPVKPFDSAKKPWKKTGSGDSSQMAYLTEKVAKLKKKLKKTKKRMEDLNEAIHTDQTGAFPHTSQHGNCYIMVAVHLNAIYIFAKPMKNRTEGEMIRVYQKIINWMKAAGLGLQKQVLNNKCLAAMKARIKENNMDYKLVPP
jgi:hypothetical protein